MTNSSTTTIRVTTKQRDRLRDLAAHRHASITETLDAALEALRRDQFYASMAAAEETLRADPESFATYVRERDTWLNADLGS